MFIVKYDASGTVLWAKGEGGSDYDTGNSVATDANGNVYATGYFASPTLVVGASTFVNAGSNDMFMVKYNSTGMLLWAKVIGGSGNDAGISLTTNEAQDVYITGNFGSPTLVVGSTTLTNANALSNTSDIFIVKYDSTGTDIWAKSAGGNSSDGVHSVATDLTGGVYLAGWFGSPTVIFGSDTLTNPGGFSIYIAKIDTTQLSVSIQSTNNTQSTITLFPNPTSSNFTITSTDKIESVKVYNLIGEEMLITTPNNNQSTININQFSNGIYFVEIKTEKGIVWKKIVKE
jgi:hypothetical protein